MEVGFRARGEKKTIQHQIKLRKVTYFQSVLNLFEFSGLYRITNNNLFIALILIVLISLFCGVHAMFEKIIFITLHFLTLVVQSFFYSRDHLLHFLSPNRSFCLLCICLFATIGIVKNQQCPIFVKSLYSDSVQNRSIKYLHTH